MGSLFIISMPLRVDVMEQQTSQDESGAINSHWTWGRLYKVPCALSDEQDLPERFEAAYTNKSMLHLLMKQAPLLNERLSNLKSGVGTKVRPDIPEWQVIEAAPITEPYGAVVAYDVWAVKPAL